MKNKRMKNVAPSRSKETFKRKIPQNKKGESSDSDGDINSNDFFHDEIDDFHSNQEKILLSGVEEHKEDDSGDEEILPITDEENSDLENEEVEEESEDDEKDHYTNSDADFESDYDNKADDDLPTLDAWGKKKSLYYNADFVDKDRGKSYREEDAEKAKAEESGALYVQNTILNQVCEGFYDLDVPPIDDGAISDEEELEATGKNWQVATKKDKLMLLNRDSPEFFVLVKDFKEKMTELLDRLQPLLSLMKDGRLPLGSGTQYIILRYHLILHYCTNISFYMVLKSKCIEAKYHPVMKRLNSFKLLLNKLDTVGEKLNPEINEILRKLQAGEEICVKEKSEKTDEINEQDTIQDIVTEDAATELFQKTDKSHKKRKMDEQFDTEIEKEISSLYMDMKRQRGRNFVEDSEDEEEIIDDKQLVTDGNAIVGEKRAVTYDIVKNKGILPYRKKEYRNPRVRNRMKYRKAKIRRKGQIREPRKEIHRYGGELTGIRSNVTKSIKIK